MILKLSLAAAAIALGAAAPLQTAPSAMPPLPKGYYAADGKSCADAANDPVGDSIGYLSGKNFVQFGEGCDTLRITAAGAGKFRETSSDCGTIQLAAKGSDGFVETISGNSRAWKYCPIASVPAAGRFYKGKD